MGTLGILDGAIVRPDGQVSTRDLLIDTDAGTIKSIEEPGELPEPDERLDADGGLVIPGLVNAHTHVAMTLLRGYADDKALHAWLEEDIFPVEAELTPDDVAAGARLGMVEMIKGGTTTFCDMYFHEGEIAEAAIDTGLRCLLGHGILTIGKDTEAIEADIDAATDFVEAYDGRENGRIKAALMPHAVRTVDLETQSRVASLAAEHTVPIHLHCSETADDVSAVTDRDGHSPVTTAEQAGLFDGSAFIAHGVHLTDGDLERLADSNTGIAHCPTANLKLASGIAPISDAITAGVPVGIGTDGPASNNDLDMLEELRLAALLAKVRADDATALPAEAAFKAATRDGATLLGFEGGRIETGAPADLAVIDLDGPQFTPHHDLLSHLVYVAASGDVRHTLCDGTVLMRDRTLEYLDEAAIRAEAARRADAVIQRAG